MKAHLDSLLHIIFGKSWVPSLIGFLAMFFTYLHELGPNLPQSTDDVGAFLEALFMGALGRSAKSTMVTNAAVPVQAQSVPTTAPSVIEVIPEVPDTIRVLPGFKIVAKTP